MFQLSDTAKFEDYIEYIKTFPLNDDPSMFGMHPNADISFAQAETYACLNTLLALQPREVGIAAASVEEVTGHLAEDMLSTIPRTFDLAIIQQKYDNNVRCFIKEYCLRVDEEKLIDRM